MPGGIEEQCRTVWANVLAALHETGMDLSNLVKVTTFLSDRACADANTAVRTEVLGRSPTRTDRAHRRHL